MKDVFISYAHEDRDSAQELARLLELSGLSVWWDPELRAGEDFAQIIEQTLQNVKCVVALWSCHSVKSRWVRAEANDGLRSEKLVPVALDDVEPPLVFRALHTLRLNTSDLHDESQVLQKLVDDIRKLTGITDATQSVPPANPSKALFHRQSFFIPLALLVIVLIIAWAGLPAYLLDSLTGKVADGTQSFSPWVVEASLSVGALLLMPVGVLLSRQGYWSGQVIAYAMAGILLSVSYVWVERWGVSSPDHLYGRVVTQDWRGLSVVALDATDQESSLQPVPVDSQDGSFGMRLKPFFANRPRFLVLRKDGCREVRSEISWEEWRKSKEMLIKFRCD